MKAVCNSCGKSKYYRNKYKAFREGWIMTFYGINGDMISCGDEDCRRWYDDNIQEHLKLKNKPNPRER